MDDKDKEILDFFLAKKEWQDFECKRALAKPANLLETVVAMANTDGGWIAIGLEDTKKAEGDKRLFGVGESPDNVSEFLKLIDKDITPLIQWITFDLGIKNIQKEEDKISIIRIRKGNVVYSLKRGDTFVRKGSQNVKIGASEIMRLQHEKGTIKFGDQTSGIESLECIDDNILNEYRDSTGSQNVDTWQFLRDSGLAIMKDDHPELTQACILLFGKNPTITLKSKFGIKISHYYGTEPSYSGESNFARRPFTIEGPLIKQITEAVNFFKESVKSSPPKLKGALFRPSLLIPEWAFQEAITNAVIHRNYFMENDVQVRLFDDRVEVESPGTYPGHITVNNIRTERFSRNPIIERVLNRFRQPPNLDIGEGVDRMFTIMRERNLYDPFYLPPDLRPHSVLLILFNQQKIEYWDTVSNYLNDHYKITNADAKKITGIKDTLKMSRMLKTWLEKGLLEKSGGKAGRGIFYTKRGKTPPDF